MTTVGYFDGAAMMKRGRLCSCGCGMYFTDLPDSHKPKGDLKMKEIHVGDWVRPIKDQTYIRKSEIYQVKAVSYFSHDTLPIVWLEGVTGGYPAEYFDWVCGPKDSLPKTYEWCEDPIKKTEDKDPRADEWQVGGDHYKRLGVTPWEAMEAWMPKEQFAGFLRGNVIKYMCREKGDPVEGAQKALHYCKKLVEVLENAPR